MYRMRRNHTKQNIIKEKNTAIFIDFDNVYISLERYYEKYDTLNIKEEFVQKFFKEFESDKILLKKAYLDFHTIQLPANMYSVLKKYSVQLYHVYSGKNASDVSLIIDVIKSMYNDKNIIDKYIIVSSDSDMLPVINELKSHGKDIEVYYFDYNTNFDYQSYLNGLQGKFHSIEKLLGQEKFVENNMLKFENPLYLKEILELMNASFVEIYNRFKKVESGQIINAGTINKGNLRDILDTKKIFVKKDIVNGFAIDTLLQKGILYEYNLPGSRYNTILINEQYLNQHGITINNLLRESDYNFPI
jgi:uncharacterized LabA/DUF88 family protein